jgi:hypothetical protein
MMNYRPISLLTTFSEAKKKRRKLSHLNFGNYVGFKVKINFHYYFTWILSSNRSSDMIISYNFSLKNVEIKSKVYYSICSVCCDLLRKVSV